MRHTELLVLVVVTGLFHFSEGKPCPERTRPHKTRCEVFYKCVTLPSRMHVWVPEKCEQGLVYEAELRMCVLPGDDWECMLGETSTLDNAITFDDAEDKDDQYDAQQRDEAVGQQTNNNNRNNNNETNDNKDEHQNEVFAADEIEDLTISASSTSTPSTTTTTSDNEIEVVPKDEDAEHNNLVDNGDDYEASGDEEAIVVSDGFLQAENREKDEEEVAMESPPPAAVQETATQATKAEPQQQQQQQQQEPEKRPAQTRHDDNEPLADRDQPPNSLESLLLLSTPTPAPSKIDPKLTEHLQRLSQLIDGLKQTYQLQGQDQHELRPHQLNAYLAHFDIKNKFDTLRVGADVPGNYQATPLSSTTPPPTPAPPLPTPAPVPAPPPPAAGANVSLAPFANQVANQTIANKLQPETKGGGLLRYGQPDYANAAHIILRQPDESTVFFNLPSASQYGGHLSDYNTPKISEETLKTVLELSKQMIAHQNVPKVVPNPATYYAQPILQPVFLPPPSGPSGNPFASYYAALAEQQGYGASASLGYGKPQKGPSNGYNNRPSGSGGSTTIIHNNLMPVHVSTADSDEKEPLDSYGQTLGLYPPLGGGASDSHQYITSVTTMRPTHSGSMSTTTLYPGEISVTTARPFEYHPSPATVAEYYTPSPHLSDANANSIFQASNGGGHSGLTYQPSGSGSVGGNMPRPMNLNRAQLQRPTTVDAASLFPAQLSANSVFIRPNSEKMESAEMLDEASSGSAASDDYVTGTGASAAGADFSSSSSNINERLQALNFNQYQPHRQLRPQQAFSSNSQFGGTLNIGQSGSLLGGLTGTGGITASGFAGGGGSANNHKNPYMPRPSTAASMGSSYGGLNNLNSNKPHTSHGLALGGQTSSQSYGGGGGGGGSSSSFNSNQLVNVGGNFISFEVFQNSILPLLGQSGQFLQSLGNVEVINCAPGIRQANTTDCTRYYVCSKKDGKVLSYSCPPYTAFNEQTRICDARTYSMCSGDALMSGYTVSENRRIQLEAIKALQEAERRRKEAMKVQSISHLLHQFGGVSGGGGLGGGGLGGGTASIEENVSGEKDMLNSYAQQAAMMTGNHQHGGGVSVGGGFVFSTTTTSRPPGKKRKYYCKEGDKIADQTSVVNYFVCYKNAQGMMKGHKMTCSKGLIFCAKTGMCTLPVKCSA